MKLPSESAIQARQKLYRLCHWLHCCHSAEFPIDHMKLYSWNPEVQRDTRVLLSTLMMCLALDAKESIEMGHSKILSLQPKLQSQNQVWVFDALRGIIIHLTVNRNTMPYNNASLVLRSRFNLYIELCPSSKWDAWPVLGKIALNCEFAIWSCQSSGQRISWVNAAPQWYKLEYTEFAGWKCLSLFHHIFQRQGLWSAWSIWEHAWIVRCHGKFLYVHTAYMPTSSSSESLLHLHQVQYGMSWWE